MARGILDIRPATLSNVCRRLRIPLDHHHALSDAEACAKIVLAAQEAELRAA
jgi:DNA polymerase-3 subunit epsilon